MKKVEKASAEINTIFEIINVVYDPTELSFDSIDVIINNFNKALSLAANIDFAGMKEELIIEAEESDDIEQIIHMTLYEFEPVINWKTETIAIPKIKESQRKDLIQYFEKLRHLNIAFTGQKMEVLTSIFENIGLRLLKVRLDLEKIIGELERRQEIKEKIDELTRGTAARYNLMLADEKVNEFIYVLLKLYENNFFLPVDSKIPFSEADVLVAFEGFLENNMIDTDWYNAEIFKEFSDIMPPLNKKSTLPHFEPEELKKELNAFFVGMQFDDFLEHLRDEFKLDKGKKIAILIYVLEKNDPSLLSIPYGKKKKFYNLLKAFFNSDIGTYQSIVNFSVSKKIHQDEINTIKDRIDNILINTV